MHWQKIIIHHSASPTKVYRAGQWTSVDAAMIREWHLARGWKDIGYHFVILPDGSCESGRPLTHPCAHCKAGNRNFMGIGICLIGNFSKTREVPEAQLSGLITKIISLMDIYTISETDIELHREAPGAATECPGLYFPAERFRQMLHESVQQA